MQFFLFSIHEYSCCIRKLALYSPLNLSTLLLSENGDLLSYKEKAPLTVAQAMQLPVKGL